MPRISYIRLLQRAKAGIEALTLTVSRVSLRLSGGRRSGGTLMRSVDMAVTRLSGTGSTCISAAPCFMAGFGFAPGPEQTDFQFKIRPWIGPCRIARGTYWAAFNASGCKAQITTATSRVMADCSAALVKARTWCSCSHWGRNENAVATPQQYSAGVKKRLWCSLTLPRSHARSVSMM